jgi:hypothetical protein
MRRLLPGIERAAPNALPPVTEILSLIDQLLVSGASPFPGYSQEDIRRMRRMLELAIFRVLKFPYSRRKIDQVPELFRQLINQLCRIGNAGWRVAIISTNYDMALDSELFRQLAADRSEGGAGIVDAGISFGMPWRDVLSGSVYLPMDAPYEVLKLHGSMNWLRCGLCEQVYVNPKGTIEHNAFDPQVRSFNTCHCGHARLEAVMVAPSLIRDIRDGALAAVWRSAIEKLRTSDEWIFAGYSLPSEDVAIRTILIRAYQGRGDNAKPKVTVAQKGDEARGRYELLFPGCRFLNGGIEDLVARALIVEGIERRAASSKVG